MTYEHRFHAMLCEYLAGLVRKTADVPTDLFVRGHKYGPQKGNLRIHYPGNVETSGTAFIYDARCANSVWPEKRGCLSFLYLLVPEDIYSFRNCVFMISIKQYIPISIGSRISSSCFVVIKYLQQYNLS